MNGWKKAIVGRCRSGLHNFFCKREAVLEISLQHRPTTLGVINSERISGTAAVSQYDAIIEPVFDIRMSRSSLVPVGPCSLAGA
jgi:hypothetical protein